MTSRRTPPSIAWRIPTEGLIVEITPILSAGAAGNWVREVLAIPATERDALLAEADGSPPDLVFLPYLAGERFPFFDTHVRAAFIGLDATHSRSDLYYAVLEGVGLAIRRQPRRARSRREGPHPACRRRRHQRDLAANARRPPRPPGLGPPRP